MLHHNSTREAMTNHYLLGTDSLAPVQLRLGMLGLTNPTYEACNLLLSHTQYTNFFSGRFQVSSYDIPSNVRHVEEKGHRSG